MRLAALGAVAVLLVAGAAYAFVIEWNPDLPATLETDIAAVDIGSSTLRTADVPATRLAPGGGASQTAGVAQESQLRLNEVESTLRPRTQDLLQRFGAREEDGNIIISLPGDVLFDFDKSNIRADAEPVLNELVEILGVYPEAPIAIEGHTDAKGGDDYNLALSERRAGAVRAYLASAGITEGRLAIRGFGESRPVAPNQHADGSDDPEGRQRNRRVEFVIGPGTGAE